MIDPPLLVFLHTAGQNPIAWQDQVTGLPAGLKAVAPWLKGLRPGRDEPFDLDTAADDVLAQLNRFGVETMAVCGLGLGAAVAVRAALRAPDNVSHLVLVAGQVRPPKLLGRLQRALIRQIDLSRVGGALGRDKLTEIIDATTLMDGPTELRQIGARTLVACGADDKVNLPAAQVLATSIPGARLEVIEGAGAAVNADRPARFNELLYGFLAG